MAQVTIAQAPVPVWDIEYIYPVISNVLGAGVQMNPKFFFLNTGQLSLGSNPYSPNAGSAGGGGVTSDYLPHKSILGAHFGTTGAPFLEAIYFPWWSPMWGPAGGESPGLLHPSAGCVVAVLDYMMATGPVTSPGTGVMFLPFNGASSTTAQQPQGASPIGGFGIVGDGAGNLEFVTWANTTGNVLSTTPIPPAVVPDFEDWNNYRFIIVTGDAANPATLSLEVNGTLLVDRLAFGSATLERPDQGIANGYTFVSQWTARTPGAPIIWARFHGRWGRTLPSGVAIQGE